jgi:hypothetical protein
LLNNLRQLWNAADLSHIPNIHSLLTHAPKQRKMLNGIGDLDLLEDDVDEMQQIAWNF